MIKGLMAIVNGPFYFTVQVCTQDHPNKKALSVDRLVERVCKLIQSAQLRPNKARLKAEIRSRAPKSKFVILKYDLPRELLLFKQTGDKWTLKRLR